MAKFFDFLFKKTPSWKFDQGPNTTAITTKQVLENHQPILRVLHYEDDHSWAFLCGTTNNPQDGRVISMSQALQIDPSLEEISDLPPGWKASRASIDAAWSKEKMS